MKRGEKIPAAGLKVSIWGNVISEWIVIDQAAAELLPYQLIWSQWGAQSRPLCIGIRFSLLLPPPPSELIGSLSFWNCDARASRRFQTDPRLESFISERTMQEWFVFFPFKFVSLALKSFLRSGNMEKRKWHRSPTVPENMVLQMIEIPLR